MRHFSKGISLVANSMPTVEELSCWNVFFVNLLHNCVFPTFRSPTMTTFKACDCILLPMQYTSDSSGSSGINK